MNISRALRTENGEILMQAFVATLAVFTLFAAAGQTYAATAQSNLTVTVNTALTFTILTNNFTSINPGSASMATTTLNVTTNDSNGYIVALSGDQKATSFNNFELIGASTTQITDQTEWVPGAATTSAGSGASTVAALVNSGNVLAFRLAASSTNGTSLTASSWWGASDNFTVSNAATLYAGISSTTNGPRTIGNAGVGSYSSSAHVNTVQYYLNVAASQPTGNYLAPITYTATGN